MHNKTRIHNEQPDYFHKLTQELRFCSIEQTIYPENQVIWRLSVINKTVSAQTAIRKTSLISHHNLRTHREKVEDAHFVHNT